MRREGTCEWQRRVIKGEVGGGIDGEGKRGENQKLIKY